MSKGGDHLSFQQEEDWRECFLAMAEAYPSDWAYRQEQTSERLDVPWDVASSQSGAETFLGLPWEEASSQASQTSQAFQVEKEQEEGARHQGKEALVQCVVLTRTP
jgi:hypothetical protein